MLVEVSVESEEPKAAPVCRAASSELTAESSVVGEQPRSRFINREASWLDFDERILALANQRSLPVLERAKFFAIFSDNLDEFFQVRVGSLKMRLAAGLPSSGPEEDTTQDRLTKINRRVTELGAERDESFASQLVPDLAAAGIRLSDWDDLGAEDQMFLDELFDAQLFPVLTPLAVDPAHPFPYISNLSLNLAVVVR